MYLKHGIDCVKYLHGQFAFVIVDTGNDSWVIGRDHIGLCPLYWVRCTKSAVFYSMLLLLPAFTYLLLLTRSITRSFIRVCIDGKRATATTALFGSVPR